MDKLNSFFSKSIRFNSYFGSNNYRQHELAEIGIKSCRFAKECSYFICACMDVTTQLELCLHEQTQIVANAACKVGSQQLLS